MERETQGLMEAMLFFKIKKASIVTLKQSDVIKINSKIINVVPADEFFMKNL